MSPVPALDPALGTTLRAALAVLLLWAARHKLRDLPGFRDALADYQLLPHRGLASIAIVLVAAELITAGGLFVPRLDRLAALAAACLFALYAGAVTINLARGRRDIDCGCAGPGAHRPLSADLVGRNGILVIAALAGALPSSPRLLTWIDGLTIAAGATTLILLYAIADGLLAHTARFDTLRHAHTAPQLAETGA